MNFFQIIVYFPCETVHRIYELHKQIIPHITLHQQKHVCIHGKKKLFGVKQKKSTSNIECKKKQLKSTKITT
jgi:uncharacterized protein YbcV (DUF1398 family)